MTVRHELRISRAALSPVLPQVLRGLERLAIVSGRPGRVLRGRPRPAFAAEISASWADTGEAAIVVSHPELPNVLALWFSIDEDGDLPDEWIVDVQDAPADLHPATREACRTATLGVALETLFHEIAFIAAGHAAAAAKGGN